MPKFESKRPYRSDRYQWIINEIPCEDTWMAQFSNVQSYQGMLNPFQYDERYLELEDRLKEKTRQLMAVTLTKRQKIIIDLYYDGYTQTEMAKMLGCNQSSITKSLHGNRDYGANKPRVYGGAFKKLKKLFDNDPEIQQILLEMRELIEEIL